MKTLLRVALVTLMGVAVVSTTAMADAEKGKKIYVKKMKSKCGFSGAKFAQKHTQDEWEAINGAGKFAEEAKKICPGLELNPKFVPDIYDFAYEYASDSGNVPSC